MACNMEMAISLFGAIAGRAAMTAIIERAHRLDSCSEGCRLGSTKGMASGSARALHLTPRGPDMSKRRTCAGSNFSCRLACL